VDEGSAICHDSPIATIRRSGRESIATFVLLHVYIVIHDSTQYRNGLISAMITGRKFYQKDDVVQDTWLG
jgi:Ni,Fe-hydrogenase I cytochrome b subunit